LKQLEENEQQPDWAKVTLHKTRNTKPNAIEDTLISRLLVFMVFGSFLPDRQ
jgi:hypothetical protein